MSGDLSRLRSLADLNSLSQGAQEDRVLLLDPEDIIVEPQVRTHFRDIEELAESMREQQQSPIIVSPLNKDTGKYLLQKGERRLRAARLIGNGFKLKAIVDSTKRTAAEQTASQMIENIQRDSLTPIEIARGLVRIRDDLQAEGKKGSGRELAKMAKKPESWVSRHLALADIPDELAQLIEDDVTSDSEIIYSLKQIGELDISRFTTLLKKARDPQQPLSREEVRNELKIAKGLTGGLGDGSGQTQTTAPQNLQAGPAQEPAGGAGGEAGGNSQASKETVEEGSNTAPNPPATTQSATTPQTNGQAQPPAKLPAKLGKSEVAVIPHEHMVIAVRVAMDRDYVTGELLLCKVCGDPSKGLVSVLIGGKPTEKLVPLDQVEILSMMPLASD